MGDVLIRDVPDDVLAALGAQARRLGLSRSEYIRRRLAQDAQSSLTAVSADDVHRFTATFEDLGDPATMSRVWE